MGIALVLTGCTNDDRAAESTDTTTSVVETRAEPQVDCSSGLSGEFGPARPGAAEVMVPDTPLFAEVCRYEKPGGEETRRISKRSPTCVDGTSRAGLPEQFHGLQRTRSRTRKSPWPRFRWQGRPGRMSRLGA
ncbi:hypothetical protein B2J88_44810 [Rhodococcus sp. SRB_17]|nr:hypothetical protein [Rhodococcus sp. SRB_17]